MRVRVSEALMDSSDGWAIGVRFIQWVSNQKLCIDNMNSIYIGPAARGVMYVSFWQDVSSLMIVGHH